MTIWMNAYDLTITKSEIFTIACTFLHKLVAASGSSKLQVLSCEGYMTVISFSLRCIASSSPSLYSEPVLFSPVDVKPFIMNHVNLSYLG